MKKANKEDVTTQEPVSAHTANAEAPRVFVRYLRTVCVVFTVLTGLFFVLYVCFSQTQHPFLESFSFRAVAGLLIAACLLAFLFCLPSLIRKSKPKKRKPAFFRFLEAVCAVSAVLILFFALLGFFYLDYAEVNQLNVTQEITNIYLIGVCAKLYLAILFFSFAECVIGLVFRAVLLHPFVKLLIHFIGTATAGALIEMFWCKGIGSAEIWGYTALIYGMLYTIGGAAYLLWEKLHNEKKEQEEYRTLYR